MYGRWNNMDTIKLLDSLEVGMPLIVTTKWSGVPAMRKVSIYGGTDGIGKYTFIDDSGIYQLTTGYIKDHCYISQELDQDTDLYEVVKLCNKIIREGRE
jgi:hypothetical protein